MNALMHDVRFALRQMRKSPVLSFTIVLVLALGIRASANTGVFTLVNAVLLKSLPVTKPEQLMEPVNLRVALLPEMSGAVPLSSLES